MCRVSNEKSKKINLKKRQVIRIGQVVGRCLIVRKMHFRLKLYWVAAERCKFTLVQVHVGEANSELLYGLKLQKKSA